MTPMPSFVRAPRALDPPDRVEMTAAQRATVHMAASLLLDYPQARGLAARLDAVEQALAGPTAPPERAGAPLAQFVATARAWGPGPWPSTTWRPSTGVGAAACT